MKKVLFSVLLVLAASIIYAQSDVGTADPSKIGVDSAQQLLKEVSVSRFEDAAYFYSHMPMDQGMVTLRRFEGGPAEKESIEDEQELDIDAPDDYVIGARVHFFKRGPHQLVLSPVRPIQIEGITKTLSLWVVGRNYNHVLKIIIRDFFGQEKELTLGKLNFMGWKKMTVAVPPTIEQSEYHYSGKDGIVFEGLKIEFDMVDTYGQYYVYFDDLRAWTDLFAEVARDDDSMSDDW
jgi:hypothetical protein